MPFREKTAWIAVVSMTVIYAFYFWSVIRHEPSTRFPYFGLLETVIALVVVQIVLITVAAIFSPRDAKAPRDASPIPDWRRAWPSPASSARSIRPSSSTPTRFCSSW
jgi:hypothetical protein